MSSAPLVVDGGHKLREEWTLSETPTQLLVLATRNPHKVREFQEMVGVLGLDVRLLSEVAPEAPEVEETGTTFLDNAALKAISAYIATGGLSSVSDDSGICVDALGGGPGVNSARFAGNDEANNDRLLAELVGKTNRAAHYYCALALVCSRKQLQSSLPSNNVHLDWPGLPDGAVLVETCGQVHGTITHERQGSGGFGYDPLFFVPQLGCTFAEVGAQTKHPISHRGLALAELINFWTRYAASKARSKL
jgi:XTP/dITP diphosphohydrolase